MLTSKQEAFCQGLALGGLEQSDAYRQAGYSTSSMQPATIWEHASRLAGQGKVKARVIELREALQEKAVTTAADILAELRGAAFSNLADLVSWSGSGVTLKDSEALPRELTALVSEVQETRQGVKIKLHGKLDALDKMARMLGAYAEQPPSTQLSLTVNLSTEDIRLLIAQAAALPLITESVTRLPEGKDGE